LIAVLVCPLHCAFGVAQFQQSEVSTAPACCQRCRAKTPAALPERVPSAPAPDSNGRCCICEGAVLDSPVQFDFGHRLGGALAPWHFPVATLVTPSNPPQLGSQFLSTADPSGGSLLGIALRSLQI
jgi:hypothetical protein